MNRLIKFLIVSILVVSIAFGIYKFNNKYEMDIISKNIDWAINYKGIKGAKSFEFDEDGNLYIAFKDYIKIVNVNDKEETLIKRKEFNIYDIAVYKNNIILATGNNIVGYDYKKDKIVDMIQGLPNNGLNKETKLLIKDDILYISIGSNTNSGIVDNENMSFDIPSFEWVLTGENYGEKKTGPFSPYGTVVKNGDKITEGQISNGIILSYNLENGKTDTFATGIRNVEGLDFNNDGQLIGIFGGMLDEGSRPIKDDTDYIYEINEKNWYGWPDYSGGDPVTSPRFAMEGMEIDPVIKNPVTRTPHGPIYEHINLGAVKGLIVDRKGSVLEEDTIVFADNKEKYLYALSNERVATKIVDLEDKSKIETIRCHKDGIFVLDSELGYLYKLQKKSNANIFNLPVIIWGFIIVFAFSLIITITSKKKRTS